MLFTKIDNRDVNLSSVLATWKDVSGSIVWSPVTCTTGSYAFYDLPLGVYTAEAMNLDGYLDVSDIDEGDLSSISVTLGSGWPLNSTGNNYVNERVRKICGLVLEDTTNNGIGNKAIGGVVLALYGANGTLTANSATTNMSGKFEFAGVAPGVYTVVEVTLDGCADVSDSNRGNPNVINVGVVSSDKCELFFVDELPISAPRSSQAPLGTASNCECWSFFGCKLGTYV